jgi:hypothetical protein
MNRQPASSRSEHSVAGKALLAAMCLVAAARAESPYPPSPVIREIVWAPVDTIVRRAVGSDNWPLTWADDDSLYTTWGDGRGFEPMVPQKLSMGFARIDGPAAFFVGVNIRSDAEQLGSGRAGRKGWGMLCVEGTLYLAMGHADGKGGQSQLAWSRDHARAWEFADWVFPQFGLVGFVNYGRDYGGARDGYVYAYSHDGPLADTPANRFVLLRVPKDRIIDRKAWEFFERRDEAGRPVWTTDVDRRGAVFSHRDACLRSAMTYNVPLRRYLWCQQIPAPRGSQDRGDTRFEGGFAIYDAPEPWGPWTTAFYTERWDVGPGEHGDFPAKWISPDGRELHLVFSGDDAFCVRKATLVLASQEAVGPVPEALREKLRLAPFYQKHLDVGGLPIVGSAKVSDDALREAAWIIRRMLTGRDDILHTLAANRVRVAVMAWNEFTTDIPEHSRLTPKAYWDRRARGLGAAPNAPAVSCGEENLLCLPGDPYHTENILIHEFAHTIHEMGLSRLDPTFDLRLNTAYEHAKEQGLWPKTYAITNRHEYWAEGVQCWFDNNRENDSSHGPINTRAELEQYDPALARLCEEVLGAGSWRYKKPTERDEADRSHLAGWDPSDSPRFQWPARGE